ncbi:tyrosine-type recombinase/integrase [Haloimpatiens sp. FM7330]|uniref:tyrosine-type recombinase/integrase n=1 Tax=Haloimpatiens sp. FM7330 TaxID=3298610 RepID=UPI00363B4F21
MTDKTNKVDGRKLRTQRKKKITVNLREDIEETIATSLTLSEVQELFIKDMENRRLREMTIKYYHFVLEGFYKYIPQTTSIIDITADTVQEYIEYQIDKGLATNTIHTNIKGIRTFLYFAMKQGFLPRFSIKVPSPNKVPLDMYTVEEVQKLLVRPNLKECKFSTLMTWTAINILAYTGCRARTLVNIKIEDIDFAGQVIHYRHTKNKKPHTVPMPLPLCNVLKQYLKVRTQGEDSTDELHLICNVYGDPITPSSLYKYVQLYNRERGVQRCGLHAFRRFYVKSLVVQGVPMPKIMHLVQHSTTNMVAHYSKMFAKDLVNDVNIFANSISVEDSKKKKFTVK